MLAKRRDEDTLYKCQYGFNEGEEVQPSDVALRDALVTGNTKLFVFSSSFRKNKNDTSPLRC